MYIPVGKSSYTNENPQKVESYLNYQSDTNSYLETYESEN